jgi:hypothetical protein
MTHYDESKPQVWHVPLREEVVEDLRVNAPRAGYVVPAAFAQVVGAKLVQHGIKFSTLGKPVAAAPVETFRADKAKFANISFESHQRLTVEGTWKQEPRSLGKGALFVPIAQPKARLVMAMFEPQAPDSLLAWGFFNNAFERKEYMEEYVAEDVAREQMARDPALAADGVEHGSSSNAMSPFGLATPSVFRSTKPNMSRSIRCDGTTVDSDEKMFSTRPGCFFSHSRIMALICLRCRFSWEPHRSHGMIGKPFTSA